MRDKLNGAIVGAACTAFIVLLSVGFGFFLGERAETGSNPAESETEAPIANLTASDSISIPGFEQITLAEGKTLQEVRLYNPPANPCYFVISLFLPDGAEIYRSGLLPPGKELDTIELLRPLDVGAYEGAFIRYSCLSLDGMTSLNGADVDLTLEVK